VSASGEGRHGGSSSGFALLFSGGLDTTLEVVERLREFDQAHLLTFNNGYCVNTGGAARRAAELEGRFGPERIRFELVNTKPLIQHLLEGSRVLWKEYRSPLILDLACKMAAVTELIRYARGNGLTDVSDGAAVDQTQIFIQHP
jgi:hypothetical protein